MHPIKRYRMVKGWTQKQLAENVGVTYQTVQFWEKGTTPWPKHLPKLAEALEVSPGQLVNEIETWNKEEKSRQ